MNENRRALIIIAIVAGVLLLVPVLYYGFILFALSQDTPTDLTAQDKSQISNMALDYFNSKYGDQDFTLDWIDTVESYNGFSYAGRNGYEGVVNAKDIDYASFRIYENDLKIASISREDFLNHYYLQNPSTPLIDGRKNLADLSTLEIDGSVIPANYGKIPSFDELIRMDAIHEIFVWQHEAADAKYGDAEEGLVNFIKAVANGLVERYQITENFTFIFRAHPYNRDYTVEVGADTISISYTNTSSEQQEADIYDFERAQIEETTKNGGA